MTATILPFRRRPDPEGVRVYSSTAPRSMAPTPAGENRQCLCCSRPATHNGHAGGGVLTSGCEQYVRQWVEAGG